MTSKDDKYLVLLRRELVRAKARLKRAERERDAALDENERLRRAMQQRRNAIQRPPKRKR
jgi:hypothetical protein